MNDLSRGTTWFVGTFLLAGAIFAGSIQSVQPLTSLTVPTGILPDGCALTPPPASSPAPITRGDVTVIRPTGSRFPTNPWSGTEGRTVAAIHKAVDAARGRPLPDVPLTVSGDAAAVERKWADNILEAYHASYTAIDGFPVEVFAVTFNDAKLATTAEPLSAMLNPPSGPTRRMVKGPTVVRVSAPTPTVCFEAIRGYIESVK